ncbi:hypothetical protein RRG08_028484 [Elysia crispata]|uniref:Uncharacterized protein n=1 Tax=Elysia crispata TaxID=231223 RepID=A0AAE1AW98_9GAST|nr:hypothetical protein RRG08_028484 [Elysia crispata]
MSGEALADGNKSGPAEIELKPVTPASDMPKVSPTENGKTSTDAGAANGRSPGAPVVVQLVSAERSRDVSPESSTRAEDDPDGVNLTPETLGPLLSTNQYTVRKMAAQGLMDVALMMANISQLRTLITAGPDLEYYYVLIYMVSFSLAAQVVFAIIIFIIWMRETEDNYREEFLATIKQIAASKSAESQAAKESLRVDRAKLEEKFRRHEWTNRLNYGTIVLVFMITVTNMFITGFGIKLEAPSAGGGSTSNQSGVTG